MVERTACIFARMRSLAYRDWEIRMIPATIPVIFIASCQNKDALSPICQGFKEFTNSV